MLTVQRLADDCSLELSAGAAGAEQPIRWVHISELDDPTPWLSGGELLLTTGIQLKGAAKQRRFVDLLADHGVAALGLGTGFEHKRVPKALRDEAEKRGMPLLEVPYEMPFIAITERAFAALVNEQYAVLERGTQVHEQLERLVIEGRGLADVLASLATAIGGAAIVQDAS
ncbi:MAG: PucR family transcriptional regulator ligand-binding domain-containing protein, partial [Chloroflexota bacterium]|nr:PucR family transcriptional regulator ligand-binding domain-containing protein [Chloroflexota bacterium]